LKAAEKISSYLLLTTYLIQLLSYYLLLHLLTTDYLLTTFVVEGCGEDLIRVALEYLR
jgi:hypothetical protein